MTGGAEDTMVNLLTSAELRGLAAVLPELLDSWAGLADTDPVRLSQGDAAAVAALRAAFAVAEPKLLSELARIGLPRVLALLDANDGDEGLADFAAAAGEALGTAGPLFLTAVASGRDQFAAEIAGRLAELRDVAALAVISPDHAPVLLARTEELTELGAALADRVRFAADAVAAGAPAAAVGQELTAWSAVVEKHLADAAPLATASDLPTLKARLAEFVARAAASRAEIDPGAVLARERRTHDALRAARLLHSQGLDNLIPGVLREAGFDAPENWRAVLDQQASPAEQPGTTPVRAGKPAPGPAAPDTPGPAPASPPTVLAELAPPGPQAFGLRVIEPAAVEPRADDEPRDDEARPDEQQPGAAEPEPEAELAVVSGLVERQPVDRQLAVAPEPAEWERSVGLASAGREPTISPESARRVAAAQPALVRPAEPPFAALRATAGPSAVVEPAASAGQGYAWCPWDGSPSLIASLLSAGKDALAVCIAEAASEPPIRQQLLRFYCAAFSCSAAALERQLPELSPADTVVRELSVDEGRLLLATVLRVGLSVGYSPVDLPSLTDRAELRSTQLQAVVAAAAEIVRRDYRREIGAAVMRRADLVPSWAVFGDRARSLLETQSKSRLPLQRASNVLHHMVEPGEPVGRALIMVIELSELGISGANADSQAQKWIHLEAIANTLGTPAGRTRLIAGTDEAVSREAQLRKRIVGVAMAKLDGALQETGRLVADLLGARTAIRQATVEADLRGAEALPQALAELGDREEPGTPGDAALRRLTDWLRDGARPSGGASVDALVDAELTPLYEIPRDAAGAPVRVPTAAEAQELLRGRDLSVVVSGYLRTGNIAAARALVAKAAEADRPALDDEVQAGLQAARRHHGQALAAVYSIAGRLRAVYDDAGARELTVLAEEPAPEDDRFDLATGRLLATVADGEKRLSGSREDLRARARRCAAAETDRQRILSLIDQQDEVLAVEFLTMAEAGQPLPQVDAERGDDFAAFFPALVHVAASAAHRREDAMAAVRTARGATGSPVNERLARGLTAWRELKSSRRGVPDDRFRRQVTDILRMIGLTPRDSSWLQELTRTHRSGYATFRLRATPVDRSYVPSLGTQAHSDYDLTLVWDEVTSTRLLDFIDERRRTRPNVIVYFNALDAVQRLQLRRSTRPGGGKGFSPLVIDDAVVGWLTTLAEPGWRLTQRVTLPFTTINPYSPFAGGEVPDEVFVGREQERAQIESQTGSMFVYGGRQLGKSALLRRVERMINEDGPEPRPTTGWRARSGRVAVYLDLKAASIGEAREPSALWPVLAERLVAAQVLPREATRVTTPERVSKLISDWLRVDDGNRLLLLLDEADNFLTKDSRARASGGAEFPNLQRLKELMGTSDRRFKAVFAGLHQVQRFHDSSNTPVAHGGDDILIGQLSALAAYQLVVDPMTALGYEFASEEHVWRLLLFANYQASLVQIVCEALVREMSRRELPPDGGRIVIDVSDVAAVIAKRDVGDLIVQRFWWTINLDPRYRVIALVVAACSLDAGLGETFRPADLHEFCELYWKAGFARAQLSGKEFRRYLEEMVGLGVLYRQDDQFGLRSPNILALLGTRQWIDQALNDAPRELEVRDEYNPSTNRRIIGKSTELWSPRSPLTDRDIANLLGLDGQHHGRVQLVTGSSALAIDRAAAVIEAVAEEQQIKCEIRSPGEVAVSPHRRAHVVVDLTSSSAAAGDLVRTFLRLSESAGGGATIIVGPECVPARLDGIGPADITAVKRWSAEDLRSWHDTPFTTPDMRTRLYRVTSGWPLLVERTMREIATGKSPEDALDLILRRLADRALAREHLADCGIDPGLAVRWAAKFGVDGDDGLVEAFPATLAELTAELGSGAVPIVERLQALDVVEETPHGWVLDRAVYAAAAALGA